jgi:hypothetical protein
MCLQELHAWMFSWTFSILWVEPTSPVYVITYYSVVKCEHTHILQLTQFLYSFFWCNYI